MSRTYGAGTVTEQTRNTNQDIWHERNTAEDIRTQTTSSKTQHRWSQGWEAVSTNVAQMWLFMPLIVLRLFLASGNRDTVSYSFKLHSQCDPSAFKIQAALQQYCLWRGTRQSMWDSCHNAKRLVLIDCWGNNMCRCPESVLSRKAHNYCQLNTR